MCKTLSVRRVRKLRRVIEKNRCPIGPGILHNVLIEDVPDVTSLGAITIMECTKCCKRFR